jgi:hypothetical protein
MKKPLISIFVCLLLFVGCDTNPDPLKIDEESKAYCLFNEGTFWVYEDSATSQRDSVVVVSNPSKIWSRNKNHEGYEMKLHTYTQEDTLENYLLVMPEYLNWPEHNPSFTCGFFSFPYLYGSNPFDWLSPKPFMQAVHFEGDPINFEGGGFETYRDPAYSSNVFDIEREVYHISYSQDNHNYFEVIVTSLTQKLIFQDSINANTKSYWAKNIGLIRFEAETDSMHIVTKLVNYNINN